MQIDLDSKEFFFKNREDAAKKLLETLPAEKMRSENWLLLSLASGAVPISELIASKFDLTYDLLFMVGIYAPNNDECQIAKVSEAQEIVMHDNLVESFEISLDYIYGEAQRKYEDELLDCQYSYRKSLSLSDINDRNVLLVDEGCETGLRVLCALKSVLALGAKKVSFATPVIAEDLYHQLEMSLDKIYTNHKIKDFIEVDYYYEELEEIDKKEIEKILNKSSNYAPFKGDR